MGSWKDSIYLVSRQIQPDKYGVQKSIEVKRKVRADSSGTTQTEFHEAGRNGIRTSDKVFTIKKRQYQGEDVIEYKDERLYVYRTYPVSEDEIELHCEMKGDSNVKSDSN